MRRLALIVVMVAGAATAHERDEFTLALPGLSIVQVFEGPDFDVDGRCGWSEPLAQGAVLGAYERSNNIVEIKRLNADGSSELVMTLAADSAADACSMETIIADNDAGAFDLVIYCDIGNDTEVWRVSGLERQVVAPPPVAGDIAPGTTGGDGIYRPIGDGTVNIANVVKLLRVSVGLETMRWSP